MIWIGILIGVACCVLVAVYSCLINSKSYRNEEDRHAAVFRWNIELPNGNDVFKYAYEISESIGEKPGQKYERPHELIEGVLKHYYDEIKKNGTEKDDSKDS
jgi:hypothetical protein